MTLGDYIKHLRTKYGITQRTLAEAMGVDTAYLSRLETGSLAHSPRIETLEAIVRALEATVEESDELHIQAGRIPRDVAGKLISHKVFMKVRKLSGNAG